MNDFSAFLIVAISLQTVGQQLFRDSCDTDRRTALHLAAMWDRDRSAKLLMDLGADPALRDRHFVIPLQYMIGNMPSVVSVLGECS